MAEVVPPKFKPFTKMRVLLTLEPTPAPMDHATDILSAQPVTFRTGAAEPAAGAEVPGGLQMFGKKKREGAAGAPGVPPRAPGAKKPRAPREAPGDVFPGLMAKARTVLGAAGAEGPQVYARMNVLSRDMQAAEIAKLPEILQAKAKSLLDVETTNPYEVEPAPPVFVPVSRRGFGSFLVDQYGPIFPRGTQKALDVATCAAAGAEGQKEVKVYHYQAFVREYLRYETPYRGLLVYHGLGSGKTCSAIAAAEALFGTRGLKVIVMTPFSLRDNFISEISFCGFKHFRLQNHWVSLSLEPSPEGPDPEMVKMFAKSVYGIPETYFAPKGRTRTKVKRIWLPDFEKESEPNFQTLSPEERNEIQVQLKTTIENRIRFINYNGITARELKTMVCSTPDIFDNAVIVVDEIHNLTRLIQGSLEPYFSNPTGRRRALPLEALSPDRKKLPLCGMTKAYMRGYLFYRLFMDAKNTKIIGLSGTPLINFPEELGILSNILHGPMNVIKFVVKVEAMRDVNATVEKAVATNENLDTVFFKAGEGVITVTVTRLPEQFTKVFGDDGDLLGIKRRNPDQAVPTLAAVWDSLQKGLKADNIQILGAAELKAQELLPSWDTPFRGAFLQEDGVTIKNDIVLQKRLRGLISYYRGIQGSVMPRVIKDEIVGVPLTGYSLKVYNKLRNEEIKTEMKKPKQGAGGKDDIWAEAGEIATMKSPSNYRMSSRQACNFVFPDGIVRPRPSNLDEQDAETGRDRDQVVDADVEDRAPGREEEENEVAVEAEEAAIVAQVQADIGEEGAVVGAAAAAALVPGARERAAAYKAAIKTAKEKLRQIGKTHLRLDGPPDKNLSRYSPKFAAMLSKILSLGGSSLIYSQFLEMEGVGIFAICMEANDFEPIEVIEADGGLRFSERTIKSLAKGPKVKENRYIEFTGAGSKEQRAAAVNVFNARIDKLNPEMAKVLREAGWEHNRDGGLCRVFCITSAGAEGLSLKCVRGVHIMEPYWNTVRTQQVKGRAVRICSHMELPDDQQNVEIYTYCSIIPDEASAAGAIDRTIERSDVYNAKEAGDLGVPIPAPMGEGGEVPAGLFLPVEQDEKLNAEAAPVGAEGAMYGAVRFYSKLDNEYRGFSNFAPAPVVIEGKRYPTVEHYFQAMKFTGDPAWAEAIRVTPTPAKAKQLGQSREHPIRDDWDRVKETVMLEGLRAKFKQNRGLLDQLKATGSRPIVEANPGDSYWGEGRTGKGKNRMGKLLEQVREELREYVIPAEGPDAAAAAAPAEAVTEDFFGGEDEVEEEGGNVEEAAVGPALGAPGGGAAGAGVPLQEGGAGGAGDDERTIILTSDQRVLLISLRKEKVIGALQNIMKSVAVDCEMNFADNNDGTYRCLNLGDSVGDFAFHPDLQQDIEETEARFKKRPAAGAAEAAPPPAVAAAVMVPLAPPPAAAPLALAAEEAVGAVPPAPTLEVGEAEAPVEAAAPAPAMAAPAPPPPPPPPAAPPAPKPKRVVIKGITYYYQLKLGTDGKPQGFLLFDSTDDTLSRPTAYIAANPKGMPTGPLLPPPA